MRTPFLWSIAALALVAAACAGPGPRERAAARLAEIERHAGEPVEKFHFWRLDRWESLGPLSVAFWSEPGRAWLITVRSPCWGLEYTQAIGLTSTMRQVHRRFDAVVFEDQRCRIAEIRPIDVKALRAERRARAASG